MVFVTTPSEQLSQLMYHHCFLPALFFPCLKCEYSLLPPHTLGQNCYNDVITGLKKGLRKKINKTSKIFKTRQLSTPKGALTRPPVLWEPFVSPHLLPRASFPERAFSHLFISQSPPERCLSPNCIFLEQPGAC